MVSRGDESVRLPLFARVRTRLLLLVLLALVPALVVLWMSAAEQRRLAEERAVDDVARLARAAAASKDQLVESTRQLLTTLAQVDAVRAADHVACERLFQALLAGHPAYANFGLVDTGGRFLASALPGWEGMEAGDRAWFQRALRTRAFAAGDYQIGRLTRKATVNFAQPVLDSSGEPVSVLFAALDLAWLGHLGTDRALPEGAAVVVTDAGGTVLARHPEAGGAVGQPFPEGAALLRADGPRRLVGADGVARVYSCVPLGGSDAARGYLAVGIDEERAVAEANRLLMRSVALLALIAGLALLAAWFGGDIFLLRRIRSLLGATQRLRDGDLSARCPAPGQASELDRLAAVFNEMAQSLQRREDEQRRSLDALREAEGRYRSLVDLCPDALFVESGGRIVFANAAALRLVAASGAEALHGKGLADLVAPEARREAEARLHALCEGKELPRAEQRFRRLDGVTVQVEVAAAPFTHEGSPAALLLARDVTTQRSLEEQLRQSQKLEAVGQLAGGVAHDFNNLLTVILGYCQLLRAEIRPSHPFREELEEIHRAAESAARLTGQLLAFSRRHVVQPRLVDINEALAGLDKMLRRLLREDIELRTVLAPGLPPVRVDPGYLEQIVMNLVVNARDAMEDGGRLTLETADAELDDVYAATHEGVRPGRYVMMAVSDTGCGMTPETRRRIFEPFFTTKGPGRGTGLGLSTVYGIVRQSGGHVWLYSEVGRGTTFKVYLPAAGLAGEGARAPLVSETVAGGSETILLVEDEDAVRKLAAHALRARGYDVIETRDGEEALRVAARHEGTIALVISDVVMPRLGGPDLVARLSGSRRDLRVLFMSGYTDNAMLHREGPNGGVALLGKPFTLDALVRKVREILDAPAPA
jgi:PAS domain S-box-containing protein